MQVIAIHPTLPVLCRLDGSVMSTVPHNSHRKWQKGHIMHTGYRTVCVNKRLQYVHRLMAQAFLKNPDGKPSVDHINRDRTDNRLSNLRFATWSEQSRNSSQYDNSYETYGVHYIDDPNEYKRRWVETHRESRRESLRRYAEKQKAKKMETCPVCKSN